MFFENKNRYPESPSAYKPYALKIDVLLNGQLGQDFSYFYNSLPIASRSGSLTTMFKGTFAENNLHAKSGYMTGVRSYAGYIKSKSSKEIAFAIILNNYISSPSVIKGKIEELLVKLSEI